MRFVTYRSDKHTLDRTAAQIRRALGILADKPASYWVSHGRERFAREFAADGLDEAEVARAIAVLDERFAPRTDLGLAGILTALESREHQRYPGGDNK